MQSDASQAASRPSFSTISIAQRDPKDFYLSAAIYAISTGEPAPSGTAMALCSEEKSILVTVVDLLSTKSSELTSSVDVLSAVRAAASLIEAASFLNDIEEN